MGRRSAAPTTLLPVARSSAAPTARRNRMLMKPPNIGGGLFRKWKKEEPLLEIPVDVENQVRRRGALDGKSSTGAERDDRIVRPRQPRPEVDRRHERRRHARGVEKHVPLRARLRHR